MSVRFVGAIGLAGLAALFVAACGGGEPSAGTGNRITNPALVPTSTPIVAPVTFRIQNAEVVVQAGGSTGPGSGPSQQTHTVASGETCQDIADIYGVTVADLQRANRSINDDCTNLGEGDNLRIPSASPTPGQGALTGTPTPTGGSGGTYEVASGDTCADIAASFGVSVGDLIALNGLDADCTTLQPGDILQIPG